MIMTNDGDLANEILESENIHEKEYIVQVDELLMMNFLGKCLKALKSQVMKVRELREYQMNWGYVRLKIIRKLN